MTMSLHNKIETTEETKTIHEAHAKPKTEKHPAPEAPKSTPSPQFLPKQHSMRFIVRDPNSVGPNNIIIEIRTGNKVIATIPVQEIRQLDLWKAGADDMRGMVIGHQVS